MSTRFGKLEYNIVEGLEYIIFGITHRKLVIEASRLASALNETTCEMSGAVVVSIACTDQESA